MNTTKSELQREINRLHEAGQLHLINNQLHYGGAPELDLAVILGVASRESNMENIAGDHGHGRGVFQIDDRFHPEWLHAHKGCKSGFWKVAAGHTALDQGYVPTSASGASVAVKILHDNYGYGMIHGIPKNHHLHFALSAYNAGQGGAMAGWYNSKNPDKFTTGGDYGKDVLERAAAIRPMLTKYNL